MTEEAVNHHYRGTRQWCKAWLGGVLLLWPWNLAGYGLAFACSGTSVYGFGLCSSIGTGLWDVAQHRGLLWLWVKCRFLGDNFLSDRAGVLSSSVIHLALGLDGVTSWVQGLVNIGAGDV